MENATRTDIRHLLRNFGIQADEAIVEHVKRMVSDEPRRLRITVEDVTGAPESPTKVFEIEGEVRG